MTSLENAAAIFATGATTLPPDDERLLVEGWRPADWEALFERAEAVPIGAGDVLIRKDAAERALYFVAAGLLEVTAILSGQSLASIARIRPGSIVGELAFLDGKPRSAKVWAATDSLLYCLDYDRYLDFAVAQPALACALTFGIGRLVATRLRRTMMLNGR